MPSIQRLNVLKTTESIFELDGDLLFDATAHDYLASVIATNTLASAGSLFVYIVPENETVEANYGLIAYNLTISGYNTYETFRFAINQGDQLYVAGSQGIAYYLQGIEQAS